MSQKLKMSIVVPCYNEEQVQEAFYQAISKALGSIDAEIELIFVDDGSRDGTLERIRKLRERDERVHYISFSRNFGKEAAMYAGFEASTGNYVAVMDVDLQDPPEMLCEMWDFIRQHKDYDCVAVRRLKREGESKVRSFFARRFYSIMNRISSTKIPEGARDFRLMSRKMVDAIVQDKEYNRFSKGIFAWVGFKTHWLEYDYAKREAGKTKWTFFRLLVYAMDGIISYSSVPLTIISIIDIFFFVIAVIGLLFVVIRALLSGDPVAGWPSMVSVMLMIGSLVLLGLGINGLYLSRIYLETKGRQLYIIKECA